MKMTIITICYNAKDTIEDTIKSVINQTAFGQVEYIVIDGKSTDGTQDIIEKYKDKISYYVSEPDQGIYNAFNKGVRAATGDYIHFLNANDVYMENNIVEQVLKNAEEYNSDFIITDTILVGREGEETYRSLKDLSRFTLFIDWIYHVTLFQKRELFKKYGLFDEKFKISSDANWFIPLLQNPQITKTYLPIPVARFGLDGVSAREETMGNTIKELEEVLSKNFINNDSFIRKLLCCRAFKVHMSFGIKLLNKLVKKTKLDDLIIKKLKKQKQWQIKYENA